jgi:hypothetical protein
MHIMHIRLQASAAFKLPHSLRAAFCAQGCADIFLSTTAVAAVISTVCDGHTSLYLYMLGLVVSCVVLHLMHSHQRWCVPYACQPWHGAKQETGSREVVGAAAAASGGGSCSS